MKTFTSLLIGCSLALAGVAMAQQPDAQPSPTNKRGAEKKQAAQTKPGANPRAAQQANGPKAQPPGIARQQERPAAAVHQQRPIGGTNRPAPAPATPKPQQAQKSQQTPKAAVAPNGGAPNQAAQPGASVMPGATKPGRHPGSKAAKTATSPAPAAAASAAAQPAASASPAAKQARQSNKAMKAPAASATAAPSTSPATAAAANTAPTAVPSASTSTSTAATAALPTPKPNTAAATKKPAPQQLQQIKAQHASFRAQPRPQQVPAVTFNPNYRIQQAQQWQAPQYEVFRSYQPEWHDQGWYRSRYQRVENIGGGYYYWNNGYWYPAWGYDQAVAYYPYDGPIYVGHRAEPADQVIADVQAELQQMGYYRGEVDGLLGPLTRQALAAYQNDSGLYQTAVIDQPTLDSLGLAS